MFENKDLHLLFNQKEIFEMADLWPMTMRLKREKLSPVLSPDKKTEGTAIGYASALWDEEEELYKIWYSPLCIKGIFYATSTDGEKWDKKGKILTPNFNQNIDNLHIISAKPKLHSWYEGCRYCGTFYNGSTGSIHIMKSKDGMSWEMNSEPTLHKIGDRSSLYYDPLREKYMFTSRPPYYENLKYSKYRKIALWESDDLYNFEYKGIILRADFEDETDVQLYGIQIFRYGNMFLGLLEIYHENIERLDTQLAFSRDGLHWERTQGRDPILAYGEEGSWDTHWVVPTLNVPFIKNNRLMFLYSGASTKHASKDKHRRAIGMASLRQDGWVSLEAGRKEGQLVTTILPVKKEETLTVNVSCQTGYFAAEILTEDGKVVPGYEYTLSKVEDVDDTRLLVSWGDKKTVSEKDIENCRIRFYLYQGSMFSYTWGEK